MAKGCWIVGVDATNPDRFGRYVGASAPGLTGLRATRLMRRAAHDGAEGARRGVDIVVAFGGHAGALSRRRLASARRKSALHRLAPSPGAFLAREKRGMKLNRRRRAR
ncbi:hypothetical protein [Rubrimonas cliftonensis]|uniref:DUF1330 domain-containing protein n=1 Tax=Rubrimonas cliftonensis TaxID=89524 RepID=A0A1H3X0M6_9RHOB|nr:hypothetical protein [Rubrimonas cliftonensis]SDZ92780.1 hypothetical protein SAMN05444370_102215 [Rubrimonas cliftonensis]